MTTPNDNDGGDQRKLSPTEAAIIEMMKKQSLGNPQTQIVSVSGGDGKNGADEKKHAFWDTQVRCNDYAAFFSTLSIS